MKTDFHEPGKADEFEYADEIKSAPELAEDYSGPRHEHTGSRTADELLRLRERNIAARKDYRPEWQDELLKERTGRIIMYLDFERALERNGIYIRFADGAKPDMKGVYAVLPTFEGGKLTYISWAQAPYMQEFDKGSVDEYGVLTHKKRQGWRTVLLDMIFKGVLTEDKAHEIFGVPNSGPHGSLYRKALYEHRNRPQK